MKNFTLLLASIIIINAGCNQPTEKNKNANVETSTDKNTQDTPMIVGADRDEHGCVHSAGYLWSEVRKECVRIWEAGNRFRNYGENKDSTLFAFLIEAEDKKSAEAFIPGGNKPVQLKMAEDNSKDPTIYQSADSGIYVKFFPSQGNYVLFIDKKAMFACPQPLK